MVKEDYNEQNIKVLKGLEAVRTRPAMYIGDTGKKGLHHLIWEILDNSVDEAMAGYCSKISVILEADGSTVSIEDNGRGIPIAIHPTEKKSALEVVLTVLHAGGKFDGQGYKAAGGLHGVGASCVNALSDHLKAEVWREGGYWTQEYSKGDPTTKVKKEKDLQKSDKQHGTRITFHPDATIFKETIKYDENVIIKRLQEVAFLNKGLEINFKNLATGTEKTILANGGISDYVKYLTEHKTGQYPSEPIYGDKKTKLSNGSELQVEIALNYAVEDDENIISFANNINTIDGGTHTSGFKTSLTRIVNQFARNTNQLKEKDPNLSGDDVREGLTAIISVRFPQPEFVGQTKAKLGTVEVEGLVSIAVNELLTDYFDKNAAVIKKIVDRAILAQEARDAAKKQSAFIKRKSFLGHNNRLPGKLSDCNSNKREVCELFIVEGNSAAGSGKDGRDSETQAILPIRGKIINAEKNDIHDLLGNKEIQSLILAIGTNIKEEFNIDNRRYDKVIIMTDADDDGSHIATLLITFFYRYMKQLVTDGHLYLAQPPLFKVDNGKEKVYCYDESEMKSAIARLGSKSKVVRFKGLGEMDAEELSETTMKKDKRRLLKLTVSDIGDTERLLSILMGSNAQARKQHITGQVNTVIAK